MTHTCRNMHTHGAVCKACAYQRACNSILVVRLGMKKKVWHGGLCTHGKLAWQCSFNAGHAKSGNFPFLG